MERKFDFLVIGSGLAGMSFALKVADKGKVAIICKTTLDEANTYFAQGGIAAVMDSISDNFDKHIEDTIICGDGHCDFSIVKDVIKEAPKQIDQLVEWGVDFDKKKEGEFDLHKEGGHSNNRILHHKDNTGAEIQTSLISKVRSHSNIEVFEHHFAIEIISQHHLGKIITHHTPDIECFGAYIMNEKNRSIFTFLSKITVMATGGIGNVYHTTSNPNIATGDGIAMAHRARAVIKDMEFVQFHPTVLFNPNERPSFLITEAMRGYGAVLRDAKGKEFMYKYDKRGSLAPRDIVARAIDNEMKISGADFVYLDVTHKNAEETKTEYPNITKKCLSLGIDITTDLIPVVPATHFLCGGIKVDKNAQTSINRLYAAGECAYTGLHGANRLASNSLLEAIYFADTAAKHSLASISKFGFQKDIPAWNDEGTSLPEEMVLITQSIKEVGQIMSSYVGIVRSNLRLKRATARLDILYRESEKLFNRSVVLREICELRNIISVAYLVIKQASLRKESRGLHYNVDYPGKNEEEVDVEFQSNI